MELFRIKKDIPFMRHALIFNVVSALTFVAAVFFLFHNHLNLSIEFEGGVVMEVSYAKPTIAEEAHRTIQGMGFTESQVQSFNDRDLLIRLPISLKGQKTSSELVFENLCNAAHASVSETQMLTEKGEHVTKQACLDSQRTEVIKLQRVETVGAQVGDELASDGIKALLMVIVGVVAYLALRFEWKFAVAAIIANLHDVVIILGFFAFFGWEFDLSVLAGVLAVLGYSVNESVVIFDRIRETFRKQRKMSVTEVIDSAITNTISRTVITHGCTLMMVLSMFFFGGQTLHNFAKALAIGILFGIYSSVFVAAAIAMWLGVKREDLIVPVKPKDETDGAVV